MPLKAVLFDMDGVIVDTEPLHRKAYFKMFEDLGITMDEELYSSFTGASTQSVCQKLISHYQLNKKWEDLAEIKRTYFKYFFDTDSSFSLLPGVLDLIKNYHEHGIKLVLASSAHINTINWVLDKFDIGKYFMGKISGASLAESKPNPEIFIKAAEIAGEPKETCMVIEDSTNGILAAYRAKIFCAAYKSEHSTGQDYSKANILVDDFSELSVDRIKTYFQ